VHRQISLQATEAGRQLDPLAGSIYKVIPQARARKWLLSHSKWVSLKFSVSCSPASRRSAQPMITFDFDKAVLQHCSMAIAVPISKRGTFTIPPEIRKRLGVDQLENPMLLVEERDGKLYLEPAAAVPVRDIPKATLRGWIQQDNAEMAAFKKTRRRRS
jgi:bifunctional DNA-binding transcriptional regulator/antitoxin component of YhaV-PrlF toxin-antitoxin module